MEQQLQQERIVIENDYEIEIDLKDLVLEILSFWKWVLFALIIGAVTAYCISRFVMVPQYESTSQFYVLSKSTGPQDSSCSITKAWVLNRSNPVSGILWSA